jgi:hypothetical protein
MTNNAKKVKDDERVLRCLEEGTSVIVGSVDPGGRPASCRAIALRSSDGLESVTVYVPVRTSQETIANVATTHRLAVVATHPIDHLSMQFKGTASGARLARDDESAFVRSRLGRFADVLSSLGIPRRVTGAVSCWPAFAIDVRVEEIFDQTPGPKAGSRVR